MMNGDPVRLVSGEPKAPHALELAFRSGREVHDGEFRGDRWSSRRSRARRSTTAATTGGQCSPRIDDEREPAVVAGDRNGLRWRCARRAASTSARRRRRRVADRETHLLRIRCGATRHDLRIAFVGSEDIGDPLSVIRELRSPHTLPGEQIVQRQLTSCRCGRRPPRYRRSARRAVRQHDLWIGLRSDRGCIRTWVLRRKRRGGQHAKE